MAGAWWMWKRSPHLTKSQVTGIWCWREAGSTEDLARLVSWTDDAATQEFQRYRTVFDIVQLALLLTWPLIFSFNSAWAMWAMSPTWK